MKIVDVKCLECNKKSEQFVENDVQYGDTATCEHCSGKAVVTPSPTFGAVPGSDTPCNGGG
jgi:DNA-directed RNA polymerase subunit RPC12/RpoP